MKESLKHLKKHKEFKTLISKHGPPDLKPGRGVFEALCRSIVYQQLSGKAAATIFGRFRALFPGKKFPKPEEVLKVSPEKLRACGLSGQKTSYLLDLAQKFAKGEINHKKFSKMTNAEISTHLTSVKGIGQWTADMFLIFTLNRLDVLPVGDLGIRKGFQVVYKLRTLPTPEKMLKLSKPWREHASVASWYFWKVADEGK